MGVIKGVLREELENAKKMKRNYEVEIKQYPGGSFVHKEIRGHKYYYLAQREGPKVKFIYKGKKLSKEDRRALKKSREMRKKYKQLIQKLNKRIKYLERILHGNEDV